MRGKFLSFVDLLAISVAVMVALLAVLPTRPHSAEPTDWYMFTLEFSARSLVKGGTDLTSRLGRGFLLSFPGEQLDLHQRGGADRRLLCIESLLELRCYFKGEPGEKVAGRFFVRDDDLLLEPGSSIEASLVLARLDLSIKQPFQLTKNTRFSKEFTGVLE